MVCGDSFMSALSPSHDVSAIGANINRNVMIMVMLRCRLFILFVLYAKFRYVQIVMHWSRLNIFKQTRGIAIVNNLYRDAGFQYHFLLLLLAFYSLDDILPVGVVTFLHPGYPFFFGCGDN